MRPTMEFCNGTAFAKFNKQSMPYGVLEDDCKGSSYECNHDGEEDDNAISEKDACLKTDHESAEHEKEERNRHDGEGHDCEHEDGDANTKRKKRNLKNGNPALSKQEDTSFECFHEMRLLQNNRIQGEEVY